MAELEAELHAQLEEQREALAGVQAIMLEADDPASAGEMAELAAELQVRLKVPSPLPHPPAWRRPCSLRAGPHASGVWLPAVQFACPFASPRCAGGHR